MTVKLNSKALAHARTLIKNGKIRHDERDAWSEHAPDAAKENRFIEDSGYAEYATWHLGIDDSHPEDTKGRYSFPFGDFSKVHRCGVISLESRAAQNNHDDIARAAKKLLEMIDRT